MSFGWSNLTAEGRKYFKELEELSQLEVHVGFQSDSESYEDGTTLPDVAAFNEFGSSDTPARPFMRQSWERHEKELQAGCDGVNKLLNRGGTAQQGLQILGSQCKGLVQEEIVSGGFAPNAPSTIRMKGSAQPLIDSGHMRQSVNFVIKKK